MVSSPPQTLRPLAIVCDGIGGHEGGNVASNLAIETIHQQLQELIRVPDQNIEPSLVLTDLDQAVAIANDKISGRNDSENRQARQRMGMLFQFGALFTDMSVYDNVAFPLREHTSLSETIIRDLVLLKLNAVGLRAARDLMPAQISGGLS